MAFDGSLPGAGQIPKNPFAAVPKMVQPSSTPVQNTQPALPNLNGASSASFVPTSQPIPPQPNFLLGPQRDVFMASQQGQAAQFQALAQYGGGQNLAAPTPKSDTTDNKKADKKNLPNPFGLTHFENGTFTPLTFEEAKNHYQSAIQEFPEGTPNFEFIRQRLELLG